MDQYGVCSSMTSWRNGVSERNVKAERAHKVTRLHNYCGKVRFGSHALEYATLPFVNTRSPQPPEASSAREPVFQSRHSSSCFCATARGRVKVSVADAAPMAHPHCKALGGLGNWGWDMSTAVCHPKVDSGCHVRSTEG